MSKGQRKAGNVESALRDFSDFILSLEHLLTSEDIEESPIHKSRSPLIIMSKKDYGSLSLQSDSAQRYISILNDVATAINPELVSRKAIDRLLRDTILRSLDINNKESIRDFAARVKSLIGEARTFLSGKASFPLRIHVRITGIEPTFEPTTFGDVEFATFTEQHIAEIKEQITQAELPEQEKMWRLETIQEMTEDKLIGKTVAIVNVQAVDFEAARSQALRKLQAVVDTINFYSDILYPRKSAFVRIFGTEEHTIESLPAFFQRDKLRLHQSTRRIGPIQTFRMYDLVHGKGQQIGSDRVSQLIAKANRTQIEERLLSSLQWAGRATIDDRNEEAFLLYTIALESLIMEKGTDTELGYRLRMRTAHLLGDNVEARKEIRKETARLYGIRSSIVHTGSFEVAQADLDLIRFFAKESIATVLIEEPFSLFQTDKELFDWFEDRLFG